MLELNVNCFGRQSKYGEWLPKDVIVNRLYYVCNGKASFTQNQEKFILEPGNLYLIPFMVSFNLTNDENEPFDHCYVDFKTDKPILSEKIYTLQPNADFFTQTAFNLFKDITGYKCNVHFDHFDVDAELLNMFSASVTYLVKQFITINDIGMATDDTFSTILNDINNSINRKITVNDLAKKYIMTPKTIINLFKRNLNTTPYAYLKKLRLAKAMYFINSGKSLDYAAQETGYADASSLLHAMNKNKLYSND